MPIHAMRIKLAEGAIEANLEAPEGPLRLVDLTYQVLVLSSAAAEMGEKAARMSGFPVSCTKGCGACCRQLVPISPPEAVLLHEMVESMPEPKKSRIKDKFSSIVDQLGKKGLLKKMENPEDPLLYGVEEEYFLQQIPCPFLEEESCGIYDVRPSRCREYLVFTPPENCSNPYKNKIGRLPVSMRLNESLTWVWSSLMKRKPRFVPLTLSLKWTRENSKTQMIGAQPKGMIRALCRHIEVIAANIEREVLQRKMSKR